MFYGSCLATAAKEVRGAFKTTEISQPGRLPLLSGGVIVTGLSLFNRRTSRVKWSPSQMEQIALAGARIHPAAGDFGSVSLLLFASSRRQSFFSHWLCLWNFLK